MERGMSCDTEAVLAMFDSRPVHVLPSIWNVFFGDRCSNLCGFYVSWPHGIWLLPTNLKFIN